ncbi:hypothetical protein E2C01_004504 [Portunus trituberculatus]|uniref:Uncharacterized protein n=1 Tax=Portunus trituberculatus TaxID=210409 RepID=A0A5B7CRY2_PORTR|nr:hypothetical protein [Portunus trituberculatus]
MHAPSLPGREAAAAAIGRASGSSRVPSRPPVSSWRRDAEFCLRCSVFFEPLVAAAVFGALEKGRPVITVDNGNLPASIRLGFRRDTLYLGLAPAPDGRHRAEGVCPAAGTSAGQALLAPGAPAPEAVPPQSSRE